MKFTIDQPAFVAALSKVIGTIEKRRTIPILGNVLIKASGGGVTITGTDLDIEVATTAAAEVSGLGVTTVSASMLNDIVKKLDKGKLVVFTADERNATIKSGRFESKLGVLPSVDFPIMASNEYDGSFTAEQWQLKRLFDLTAFAMSTEETRFYLNGVYLQSHGGNVRTVSTDGHRLALADSSIESECQGVIVPRKTVGIIKPLLSGEDSAKVSVSATKVKFDLGETVIVSKVIDGNFPDYTRVIPADFNITVSIDAAKLKTASDRVTTVSTERTRAVAIKLTDSQMTLEVDGGLDAGREDIEVEYQGDEFKIGANSKYLAEVLQMCSGSDAVLSFNTPNDPMRIKTSDDDSVLWVVMPMRI